MNSERLWVVVLAVTSFLAGAAASLFLTLRRNPVQEYGPHAAYEAQLVETYGIEAEERRKLRQILDVYHEEIEVLKARQLEEYDAEKAKAGEDCFQRIHDWVIPADRLAQFRRDLEPISSETIAGRPE